MSILCTAMHWRKLHKLTFIGLAALTVLRCVLNMLWHGTVVPLRGASPAHHRGPLQHGGISLFHASNPSCTGDVSDLALTKILQRAFPRGNPDEDTGTIPHWIKVLCPRVADHFELFPYFTHFVDDMPMMTTAYAAHTVCTAQLAADVAATIGDTMYLHAGSHLGAVVHGGPIPWDDDADLFLSLDRKDAFVKASTAMNSLSAIQALDVRVGCTQWSAALKFFILTEDSANTSFGWPTPFVDVFLYNQNRSHIFEVFPSGQPRRQLYRLKEYFPTRPYYFGGATIFGPQESIPRGRYDMRRCVMADYNHRLERDPSYNGSYNLDCCALAQVFPFVYQDNLISNGRSSKRMDHRL